MGERSRRHKQLAAGARMAGEEQAIGRPMTEAFQEYYPKAREAQWGAMKMPAVRGMYAQAGREIGGEAARYGMGGSGVESARRRRLSSQMSQQLGQLQFQQAGQYGEMAGQVARGGIQGLGLMTEQDRRLREYWEQRTEQRRAEKEASRAREAATWGGVAEAGMDIGMAVATGGASVPASLAYRRDRRRIQG